MNYKLLYQLEVRQNKAILKELFNLEAKLADTQLDAMEAKKELEEYKSTLRNLTSKINSYTADLKIDIKA